MLSEHFSESEMSCHHCGQLPAGGISGVLLDGLERLRTIVGKPIYVTNAYRCPEHNAAVGGVSNSQHVHGTAADIYVDGMGVWELANIANRFLTVLGSITVRSLCMWICVTMVILPVYIFGTIRNKYLEGGD